MTTLSSRQRRTTLTVRAAIALLVAVALTGCIKMDMDLTLDADKVDGAVVVGVSKQILDMTGSSPDEALDEMIDDSTIPEGSSVEPYEDDEFIGQRTVFDGIDIEEFNDEDMSITYDADAGTYEVDGTFDMTEDAEDMGDIPPDMADSLLGSFDMSISITFPGEVTEHTGELDGTTVTWTPALGEENVIRAVASDSGSSGLPTWLIIVIAAVVAIVVAGIVFLMARRSRGRGEPSVEGPAGEPPTGASTVDEGPSA